MGQGIQAHGNTGGRGFGAEEQTDLQVHVSGRGYINEVSRNALGAGIGGGAAIQSITKRSHRVAIGQAHGGGSDESESPIG